MKTNEAKAFSSLGQMARSLTLKIDVERVNYRACRRKHENRKSRLKGWRFLRTQRLGKEQATLDFISYSQSRYVVATRMHNY